jgi:hypothetical protein
MKKNLIVALLLFGLTTQAQNVLRVNNIPGVNVPYTTIQAAVTAASAGDIILVEGSPTAYNVGAFDLTKKLTIRGPGFFLNENTTVQASQNPATIVSSTFYFSPGSDGSIISGLTMNSTVDVKTSNITISNNRFSGNPIIKLSNASPANNLLISNNYLDMNTLVNITSGSQTFTNVLITNNLINNQAGNPSISLGSSTFAVVKNNILNSGVGDNIPNCDIVNNIFLGPAISNAFNSTIRNNVFKVASQAGADATNIFNAVQANLFVGLTGNTTDTQWMLKSGSVAIGAGALGEDCGIYGGVTPYKISGVGAGLSAITTFNVPASVPQNGILNVKVSAKVN